MKKKVLNFKLNGDPMELLVSPEDTLLDVLRDQLGLPELKRVAAKENVAPVPL